MKHRTPYWADPDRAADEDDMPEVGDAEPRDYVPVDIGPSDRDCDRAANMYFGAIRRNHD